MENVYVRGNMIKYIRIPEEVLTLHHEKRDENKKNFKSTRGGRGGQRGGGTRGSSTRGGRGGQRGEKK
jgi:U6 snRNA-associated Sm-like protein LSm4